MDTPPYLIPQPINVKSVRWKRVIESSKITIRISKNSAFMPFSNEKRRICVN